MKLTKTIPVTLILLTFLAANVGFSLSKHLCHGNVKSVAIYSSADKCANEMNHHEGEASHKESCCDDETNYLQDESFKNLGNDTSFVCKFIPVKLISELVMEAFPAPELISHYDIEYIQKLPFPPPVPANIWHCSFLI